MDAGTGPFASLSIVSSDESRSLETYWSHVLQVEVPQPGIPGGLARSSGLEAWPTKELLDQSGSNDFSAYKEIQELKDACAVLRCAASYTTFLDIACPPSSKVSAQCFYTPLPLLQQSCLWPILSPYALKSDQSKDGSW